MRKLAAGLVFMGVMAGVSGANTTQGNFNPSGPPPAASPAVLAAIAALQSQVATLTVKVSTLNTQVNKLQGNVTAADLAGNYTMIQTAFEQQVVSGDDESGFNDDYVTTLNTITLNSNFTFTVTSNNYTYSFGANIATCCNAGDAAGSDPLNSSQQTNSGTWSYSGGILTINVTSGPTLTLTGADGGRMFVAVLTDSSGAPQATTMVRNN
jgi:hypothetical protein